MIEYILNNLFGIGVFIAMLCLPMCIFNKGNVLPILKISIVIMIIGIITQHFLK